MKPYPLYNSKELIQYFGHDPTKGSGRDILIWLHYNSRDENYVMVLHLDQYVLECEQQEFKTLPSPEVVKFLTDVLKEFGECRDHESSLPSGGWKQVDILVV